MYSANLISMLAMQKSELPIKSLEDLSKQSDIRLLLQDGTFLQNAFKSSRDDVMRKAYENSKTIKEMNHSVIFDMIRKSSGGKWASPNTYSWLLTQEAKDCNNFAVLPEIFMTSTMLAFALPKNAFYADKVNFLIQSMVESAYIYKRRVWWRKMSNRSSCEEQLASTASFSATEMADLTGILAVFGVFAAAAVAILTVERILQKVVNVRFESTRL